MVLVTHWEWPELEGTDWEADGLVNRLGMGNVVSQEWDKHLEDIELKVNGRLDLEDIELQPNGGGMDWDVQIGVLRIGNVQIWDDIHLDLNGGCMDWDVRIGVLRIVHGQTSLIFHARACPGRQLDESSLFISMASVVACVNISPKPSAERPERTFGFIRRLILFPVNITPRSPKWRDIVEREVLPTA
ncbi:hypothetical protein JB92DRAFT_3103690 [Gautieria morchelliformis]|nr:hypothetical protein JB92DRAFT_3103690 [Gautieria morchelliformis]